MTQRDGRHMPPTSSCRPSRSRAWRRSPGRTGAPTPRRPTGWRSSSRSWRASRTARCSPAGSGSTRPSGPSPPPRRRPRARRAQGPGPVEEPRLHRGRRRRLGAGPARPRGPGQTEQVGDVGGLRGPHREGLHARPRPVPLPLGARGEARPRERGAQRRAPEGRPGRAEPPRPRQQGLLRAEAAPARTRASPGTACRDTSTWRRWR